MLQFDFISLGIGLTVIGLLFLGAVILMLRTVAVYRPSYQPIVAIAGELLPEHGDAVLLVENGGRIRAMNERARQAFQIQEGESPTLERLIRRTRPTEALLKLCAVEGQARFVLDGRLVEGTSYRVEVDGTSPVLISLRYPDLGTAGSKSGGLNAQTLQTFTQLTQEMAASLDLKETLQAIMSNVEKLVPAEFMEITIWDEESESFTPYRYTGLPGLDRKLDLVNIRYSVKDSFSGRLYQDRKPLLIPDMETNREMHLIAERLSIPMRSYLGFPLLVGNEFIGTLEFGSMNADSFHEEDMGLVRMLSGQAAVAVHNALLYQEEQRRSLELSGLAQLVQAFSSVRDPSGLFARLVDSIKPLIPVNLLGFLIYNENIRVLEARIPFHGLPNQVVDLYRTEIVVGSPAEQFLINQDLLITDNASEDEKWEQLGLTYVAQAASLRETVLVPLSVGGHMLGYLQASNHTSGPSAFSQPELHLLTIIANQSASIIENATLVQQSRQRAQRAEALRRLANLASSAATLDEILQFSLQELTRLLRADVGAIFLVNQDHTLLQLREATVNPSAPALPERLTHMLLEDPQFPFTVTGSQHALTSGHASGNGKPIVPFYQSILDHWGLESLIVVPLVVRNEGLGEIWFGSALADFFDQGDVQMVSTAAGQLAGVVEQSFLISQTDESLRRRVDQMTAITRISRELSTSLDLEYLLQMVYDEALRTTNADCGTIMLFDLNQLPENSGPTIRFYVGDKPGAALTALERLVLERDLPQLVSDINRSEYERPHGEVQSMLVTPISYQLRHAGLITLHGRNPNQFDQTSLDITQSLAIQAAVALNNALAFEEQKHNSALLKRELDTLSRLIDVTRTVRPNHSLVQSLNTIASAIQSVTPFETVLISVYDPSIEALRRTAGAGLTNEAWDQLRAHTQPWRSITQLMRAEYQVGNAFYIPENRIPTIPDDVYVVNVLPSKNGSTDEETWHARDMLLVPLRNSDQSPLGLISVDAPRDCRRPDRPTFEALELFAAQASLILESHLRADTLENQLAELELEKTRFELSSRQAQENLPVLLRKELEQSISLRGLNQRIERVRATIEIAADANRQETSQAVLRTLASELLTRFAMQVALVAEQAPTGIRLLDVVGTFPAGTNPEALLGQRNPLRHMLQPNRPSDGGLILISNLENHQEWQNVTLLNVLEARSIIGLTLNIGEQMVGVLAIGQRNLPPFLEEDRRVFSQLAYQVSVGLQNLQLLNETRQRLQEVNLLLDFGRKLGRLDPKEILTSLVESIAQVIPNANAGWVGMWEEKDLAIVPQAAMGYQSQQDILGIRYWLQSPSGDIMDTRVVLPLRVFRTGSTERVAEVDFASQYHLSAEDLQRYRRATGGRLPISVMLIPLRIADNVLGVVCLENFKSQGAFTEEDEDLAYSFTRQAAMALENARLYQASEQRATQLQALTMVAGTITSSLQRDELIALLLSQLKIVVPYNTATLWLRQGDILTVVAATGFPDNDSRINLSVAVEDSQLFKTMIQTTEPISVGDVRNDPRFPSLLEPENISWLGIPLIYKSAVMGVIALEKREPDSYSSEIIQAATTYAGQAAVSLENARLFEESQRRTIELDERSKRLALLNRLSADLVASLDIDFIFKLTGQELVSAMDASGVVAIMTNQAGQYMMQVELPSHPQSNLPMPLPPTPLFEHLAESLGVFLTDQISAEKELAPLVKSFFKPRKAQSLLVVPLTAGAILQGWFMLYTDRQYRYSSSEVELARTICNQAAIAIQNARLFAETRRLTEDLERRVEERTREVRREHQNSQTLLRIITELSTSLDMSLVLNRTLNVLNESVGAEESIIIMSQGNITQHRAGIQLARMQDTSHGIPLERQIARWVIRANQPAVIGRVQDDTRWEIAPDASPAYQSVLAVPLIMGEDVLGALVLFHRQSHFFNQDQINMMEATARQIGIALNNAELFNLIRDQSEHLGSMLREQQIEASRSRAILEAVADGVLVTDSQGRINLFNISAERILDLKSNQVIGKSLDQFVGLFGKTTIDWIQTIRDWSQDPTIQRSGESYAERIDLDNGRIVSVHLAPVFWRQEFLGTVSIFRDITHEVQVDRLKSEFVANVSHELRTPMTSIKGYVEIMLMGASGELNPQQVHFLKIVKSNTERLSVLVNDLLDVSRIEAGRLTLNLQALDMKEIAEDVIADLQRRSNEENRPMKFVLEIPKGLPFAYGDTERVRQVLGNLVSNGYNYTPDNGCVNVRITEVDKHLRVDVQDNGIGIGPKEKHRIFERFYRGEDPLVLATAGFGLGLAIAKTLVEMHHGEMWFESSGVRGEGSVFSFTLPVHENEE